MKPYLTGCLAGVLLLALMPSADAEPAASVCALATAESDSLRAAQLDNQQAQAAYYRHQVEQPGEAKLPLGFNAALPIIALVVGSLLTYWVAKRQAAEERGRLYERQIPVETSLSCASLA